QKPKMLHARVTAVGANRAFVADRLGEINARVLEAIDAGKNLRPDDAAERLVARISAAIVYVARSDGSDDAIFIERHAGVAEGALVAVGAGSHVLRAALHPLHRLAAGLAG